jgi:hypothetical protein
MRRYHAVMAVRISVALCTYNGQAYLPEQLQSLSKQSRAPDEMVIRDDRSTDRTVAILRGFAESAPFPVSIVINETTLGPAKNFEATIAACTGDVIALCDQDDVWAPDKLAAIDRAFTDSPRLGAFFSDAEICDASGDDLGYRLWSSVGLTGRLLRQFLDGGAFDVILRQNVVTGATLAFASRYRSLTLPIDSLWMHDGWIALLIAACAPVVAYPQPLIRYRQHATQSIGAARRSLLQQYQNARAMDRMVFAQQVRMFQAVSDRLEDFSRSDAGRTMTGSCPQDSHLQRLSEKIRHSQARSAIRLGQASRWSSVAELLSLRYRRFSLGWKSFSQDLFL